MSTKFKNYFGKQRKLLKILGVSLTGDEGLIYKIYSICIIIFVDITYVVLDLVEIFKNDVSVLSESIGYQFSVTVALAKTILILRYRERFRKMLDRLEDPPFRPNRERGGEEEEKIMEECLWITNWQNMVYWCLCILTVFSAISNTIFRRIQSNDYQGLTYGPFSVLNITYSPNYEITCLYQSFAVSNLALLFTTADLIIAGLLAHVSYQFKILQNNFRRLVQIGYTKMLKDTNTIETLDRCTEIDGSRIPLKYLQEALVEAVDYHSAIIDFANEMENLFSGLLLFVFLGTLIIVGVLTFSASQISLNDSALLPSLGEATVACLQVLTVCYWGEEMVLQSQQVGTAIYETNFVETDISFQKSLILLMRRSLNPTSMTAGKFAPLRLTTFIWIMRSAYSAFMVMRRNNV